MKLQSKIKHTSNKAEHQVTTVRSNHRVTTSTGPTPFRLTPNDKRELAEWIEELQALTPKKLSPAKVLRGLIAMRKDISAETLLNAIKNVT